MTLMPLPAGVWVPPSNAVPGYLQYIGVPGTVIAAAHPDTEFVTIGPRCLLRDVAIYDAFGLNVPVMRPLGNGDTNAPRPVRYLENATDEPMISRHWACTSRFIEGGKPDVDAPVHQMRVTGIGNAGEYVEARGSAFGFHTWALEKASGFVAQLFGTGSGVRVIAEPGCNPMYGAVAITSRADVRSLHIQPDVDTGCDVAFVSAHKTGGAFLRFYQASSNFAGDGIHMNFGNGGQFTGNFVAFDVDGVPVFRLTRDGNVVGGVLADRLATLESAVEVLQHS